MKTIIKISVLLSLLFFIYQCGFFESLTVKTVEEVLEEYKYKEKDPRFFGWWKWKQKDNKLEALEYFSDRGYIDGFMIVIDNKTKYFKGIFSVDTVKKKICIPPPHLDVLFWHTDKKNKIFYDKKIRRNHKQGDLISKNYYEFSNNNNELNFYLDKTKDPELTYTKATQKELDSIYQVGVKKGYIGCK